MAASIFAQRTSIADRGASGPLRWQVNQVYCTASRFYAPSAKCLPRKTHTCLYNRMIHHLNGKAVFKHDGSAVEGSSPVPVIDRLTAPDLLKHTDPYIMGQSDFDSEVLRC